MGATLSPILLFFWPEVSAVRHRRITEIIRENCHEFCLFYAR